MEKVTRRQILEWGLVAAGMMFGLPSSTNRRVSAASIETPQMQKEIDRREIYRRIIKPLEDEALRKRDKRAAQNPEYSHRVDQELNEGRVNIALVGYGETHEPPLTERAIIGSISIFSLNTETGKVDIVSLTHDIRAPEIEKYEASRGRNSGYPIKIGKAYPTGGFSLMRRTLEDATGFSIDYQAVFRDSLIVEFVDNVVEGIDVDNTTDFDVHPFYLNGVKYGPGHFPAGRYMFGGQRAIQFIKTVPKTDGSYYGKHLEHNVRKHVVFRSIFQEIEEHSGDAGFLIKLLSFFNEQRSKGLLRYDVNLGEFFTNNLGSIIDSLRNVVVHKDDIALIEFGKALYVVDPAQSEVKGGFGIRWVTAEAVENPIIKREIEEKFYEYPGVVGDPYGVEVPVGGDPNAPDLVTGYWKSMRSRIKALVFEA
ncbi:LCP family protein [Candidatus Microgenomates bacterium]|nr:LCP family protein [Candidatus Microgenomates bacterium]